MKALPFHIIVRPLGNVQLTAGPLISTNGRDVPTWFADDASRLGQQGFGIAYEDLSERLLEIPRLFLEPDASFVWVSSEDPERRMSGQITDDGREVLYLELRGRCRWEDLSQILTRFDLPPAELLFQWLPEARLLRAEQFRLLLGD